MKKISKNNHIFKTKTKPPKKCLVLIFDLENSSSFFSHPDVQSYIPKFLNYVFDCMSVLINGGKAYWDENHKQYKPFAEPRAWKFLGDGALYLWPYELLEEIVNPEFFINRLRTLKLKFHDVVLKCFEEVPVIHLPQKIRFGLTVGSVTELDYSNSQKHEYVGYCINLASRLQGYCRELGLIVSARLVLTPEQLERNSLIKVVTKNLKGFPNEPVYVDKLEYNNLDNEIKENLFDEFIFRISK